MSVFVVGQRWASSTEAELGLGVVTEVELRRVTLFFPCIQEHRTYSASQHPLNRVHFSKGDNLVLNNGDKARILGAENNQGYLIYLVELLSGEQKIVPEQELPSTLFLNSIKDQLLSGQLSGGSWFYLKTLALTEPSQHQHSLASGLQGPKTQLIPHQYYIAQKIGRSHAPRVLLADEVGLGKTIEAGLIMHQQIYTGRVQRILVIVPDALVHQWLVEMLRKFNLRFSMVDQEYCEAARKSSFVTDQLLLVPKSLIDYPNCLDLFIQNRWDLLVVDEAHHFGQNIHTSDNDFLALKRLCEVAKGVLLLTATFEQFGIDGHFARLQLLDPHRYTNLSAFQDLENQYQCVTQAIEPILAGNISITSEQEQLLKTYLAKDQSTLKRYQQDPTVENQSALLKTLLDRYGPGATFFRNTRKHIKGFPKRCLISIPLPLPSDYPTDKIYPEQSIQDQSWLENDPRVSWLKQYITQIAPNKALIICHDQATAIDLFHHFKVRTNITVCVFHESMTLIERDRAAAYFAASEESAQVLICSEMGSEGRNFQFVHKLILFDLPKSPDLLEQRIGRLDRIGQAHEIQINVLYLEASAQEVLFYWYHHALNFFTAPSPTASKIHQIYQHRLNEHLRNPSDNYDAFFKAVFKESNTLAVTYSEGYNALLELNSYNLIEAQSIIKEIKQQDENSTVKEFLELAFACYGYEVENLDIDLYIVKPCAYTLTQIPGLEEEGFIYTYSREIALKRDEIAWITWEHPLVITVLDLLLTNQDGNTDVALMNYPNHHHGAVYLELLFRLRVNAPTYHQIQRFLPDSVLRIVVNDAGELLTDELDAKTIEKNKITIDFNQALEILESQRQNVIFMYENGIKYGKKFFQNLMIKAKKKAVDEGNFEYNRLRHFKEHNASIRNQEFTFLEEQIKSIQQSLQEGTLHLEALRLIVNVRNTGA